MPKKTSIAWTVFTKEDSSSVRCTICNQVFKYSSNSTNMMKHLISRHPLQLQEKEKERAEENRVPTPQVASSSGASVKLQSVQPNIVESLTKHELYARGTPKREALDTLVARMVVKDIQPFSIVEDVGFKDFVHGLDPKYPLPGRKTLTDRLIPAMMSKESVRLQGDLQDASHITITTDEWTSRATRGYMGVTAHFVDSNFMLQSRLLEIRRITSSTTAENLASELNDVMENWEIRNKVIAIVTDNAANIVAAVNKLGIKHVPCFAHTLNLIVQKAIDESGRLEKIREKVRDVLAYFHRSVKASNALEKELKELPADQGEKKLKLVQEVRTRWNSTYKMLSRYSLIYRHVNRVLSDHSKLNLITTDDEIKDIQESIEALVPFEEATIEMSAEKVATIAKVIPLVRGLKELTRASSHSELGQKLLEHLNKRFMRTEENFIWATATFLDPRFKHHDFATKEAVATTKEMIMSQILPTPAAESTTDADIPPPAKKSKVLKIWESHDARVEMIQKSSVLPSVRPNLEMSKYEKETVLDRGRDPLMWWKTEGSLMPELQKLAKKYLCCPATSTPSERLFSKAGELINQRRANLSDKNVNMVLFLNKNMK